MAGQVGARVRLLVVLEARVRSRELGLLQHHRRSPEQHLWAESALETVSVCWECSRDSICGLRVL